MAPTTATGDSVRSYLKDIGRIPLLEHEEEILLGRKVQKLMELEDKRKEFEQQHDRKIDDRELCDLTSSDWKEMRRELRQGRKAKDKMVTANLRLVVSVAKKYTKRNMDLLDIIQELERL